MYHMSSGASLGGWWILLPLVVFLRCGKKKKATYSVGAWCDTVVCSALTDDWNTYQMWLRYSTLLLLQSENTGSLVTEYYIGPFFWLVGFLVLGFFFYFFVRCWDVQCNALKWYLILKINKQAHNYCSPRLSNVLHLAFCFADCKKCSDSVLGSTVSLMINNKNQL